MTSTLRLCPIRVQLSSRVPRVRRNASTCPRCLQPDQRAFPAVRQTEYLRRFKQPSRTHLRSHSVASTNEQLQSSPLAALSHKIGSRPAKRAANPSSFPSTCSKSSAYWLLASAASVFGIVVFGGLTRLTESGLSITEWRPVTGSLPPRDREAWEEEFARYRRSPEFKMLNSRMNLEEFQQIYWMEWTHRLWGRVVGVTFLLPTAYFIVRRRVSRPMAGRLVAICGLIGFQGGLGWWMVKSGLKDDLLERGQHPRVSQYRLAAHLGTAFVAYLAMLYNGLSILRERRLLRDPEQGMALAQSLQRPELRRFKRLVAGLAVLVFATAMSGALVAGLDAGLIYNDFPWMGQGLVPPTRELLDPFYSHTPDRTDLVWRNMLENPVLVQLDHRALATTTFAAILALWGYARFRRRVCTALPPESHKALRGVVQLACVQVALGISTLWYLVPTPLAAAHQAGALALLSGVCVLGVRLHVPARTLRILERRCSRHSPRKVGVSNMRPLQTK